MVTMFLILKWKASMCPFLLQNLFYSKVRLKHRGTVEVVTAACKERILQLYYSRDLKYGLVWIWERSERGWVAIGLNFEWDLQSGIPTIWDPDNLRSGQKFLIWMVETIAIAIAKPNLLKTGPFEIRPCKCFLISNLQISDPHFTLFFCFSTFLQFSIVLKFS